MDFLHTSAIQPWRNANLRLATSTLRQIFFVRFQLLKTVSSSWHVACSA
jgi:hypothetical protein